MSVLFTSSLITIITAADNDFDCGKAQAAQETDKEGRSMWQATNFLQ